jgi:hypothetical protein
MLDEIDHPVSRSSWRFSVWTLAVHNKQYLRSGQRIYLALLPLQRHLRLLLLPTLRHLSHIRIRKVLLQALFDSLLKRAIAGLTLLISTELS